MSTMANTTPIVTTVMKTTNKKKTSKEADAALKANILDFCEEHYEDILPVIMDKIRRDKRKEVHARLDFGENPRKSRKVKKGSQNSSAGTCPQGIGLTVEDVLADGALLAKTVLETETAPVALKNNIVIPAPPTGQGTGMDITLSGTNDERHWKTREKRRKPADEEDLSVPWTCEDVDLFTPQIRNFKSSRKTRMPNNVKTYDETGDPEVHLKIFQAATQRDGETIEEFIERFKIETGRMKGAPECMRISGFMHGVKNPELIKRLNARPKDCGGNDDCHHGFHTGRNRCRFQKESSHSLKVTGPIEELVRAGKLSHFIKEIRQDRDQQKTRKKDALVKDKAASIYMIWPWQRVMRQKVTQSFAHVKEITFPPLTANKGTGGPLVIEAETGGHAVHRIYVDRGSSIEVLYEHCFNRLWPEIKSQMVLATTSLTDFSGETIWPLGQLRLLVTIGDAEHYKKAWMNFIIVRSPSPYNGIIGRLRIREIQAVPSTTHGMLKFSVNGRIVTSRSTILTPTECATIAATPKDPAKKAEARHEKIKVVIHPDFSNQEITIGGAYHDRLSSIDSISEKDIPLSDKKRRQASKRAKAIQVEVQKLVEAGILREVYYQDWLSNPVMVRKHDGSWRMCMDFTDLNKACPQDCYPLPKIDWKVESLYGYLFKCFLDAYKRYHQKHMAEQNEEKTAFHTSHGVYCYTKMPFGLKNTGTTYQRLVDKAFDRKIGLNLKIYVDDLVIKSHTETELLRDIEETFRTLRKINMQLNPKKCAGLILTILEGTEFTYALRFKFTASNNEAEYEALIVGLRIAAQMGVHNVYVNVDSKLVANQVLGTYVSKEENMIKYLENTKSLISGFANFSISQVPRSKTKKADALSKIASTSFAYLSKQFLVEILKEKSIQEKEMTTVVEEEGPTWMTLIIEYLRDETLPDNRKEARKLYIKARQYELLEEILYRHLFLKSWLRCIGPLQADYVIRKIHEGSCSMHAGPRSMVAKAIRSGYYWPTMHQDAREMIRKCKDFHIHLPGIEIAGPFPEGPEKVKFLIVAMDYFTKWIEAKAVAIISGRQHFTLVKHPQSNELIERANRSLGEGIKARQGEGNKNRLEELPHVLWTHRTMIKSSNDDILFSLTYRTKAVIPAEIRMPTYRTAVVDAVHNDEELRLNLDLLEERHERAVICEAKSKLNMTKYYNARVRGITFRQGDFFYRSNDARHAVDGRKLGSKWEGPYEVTEALEDGAYKLRSTDETVLPMMCYIDNLKKCYL
nr:reverse transcriptase domain-containing protein [Tanacetum cinerariifolium]